MKRSVEMGGWGLIFTKYHWFSSATETVSLCRRVTRSFLDIRLHPGNDDSPDNCPTCRKRLARNRKEKL